MPESTYSIDTLLEWMVGRGASDLHLTVGSQPAIRVNGHLHRLDNFPALTAEDSRQLLYRILNTEQQKRLEIDRQIDLSHSIPGVARFRVNIYSQRESLAGAFRMIPDSLKTLEELGLPTSLYELANKPRGLVLVTGPTGSGKSTTLSALIDEINRTRARPHHHDRGPDRVPAPPQAVRGEPAGDRPRRHQLRRGAPRRAPPGPRRDPPGRDARPRDDLDRADRRRDRPPRLRDAAHPGRRLDDRPRHRRVPGRAAGSDPHAARRHDPGRRRPGAPADRRRPGPCAGDRDPAPGRRRPEPDPPGEARADLLGHADQHGPRHADDGAVARRPRHPPCRHP